MDSTTLSLSLRMPKGPARRSALKAVRDALTGTAGDVTAAAKLLKVHPDTLHRWLREDPGLAKAPRQGRVGRLARYRPKKSAAKNGRSANNRPGRG